MVACAHQAGVVTATRDAPPAAGTPGWRITQVLPNLTTGGLWAGGARAAFPYTGIAISPVTPDGRGGVWLVMQAGANNKQWFCHYSAGRWTRTPVPSRSGEQPGVSDLVWVPGTHSQWAVGDVSSANDDGTAILKYGT